MNAELVQNIALIALIAVFVYGVTVVVFDLLLRGFAPFLPSRPWVVNQILSELAIDKPRPMMIAFSTGRSGFFRSLEKLYPDATLIGVEPGLFAYIIARLQIILRRTKIRVIHSPVHRVDVSQADFIYSHLYPDKMDGMGKKLKFECRPGAIAVSTGFIIPGLNPKKVIDLPDRRGRMDWLSGNVKLFQRSKKKYKKEKKAYFYEI